METTPSPDEPQQPIASEQISTPPVAPNSTKRTSSTKARDSIILKIIVCVFLGLLLLAPSGMISFLIDDRQALHNKAKEEISDKWGKGQRMAGPVLILPFTSGKGDAKVKKLLYVFPDTLTIEGELKPEVRYRGIYNAVLYTADLQMHGLFTKPDLSALQIEPKNVLWSEATVMIGITDVHGVQSVGKLMWKGNETVLHPGLPANLVLKTGMSGPVSVDSAMTTIPFSFSMVVNGSGSEGSATTANAPREPVEAAGPAQTADASPQYLPGTRGGFNVLPLGKQTTVRLKSKWSTPSFSGTFLPATRKVGDDGFTAEWSVSEFNRNFQQQMVDVKTDDVYASEFGVGLLEPVDTYQKSTRAVKYVVLFIALSFLTFFLFEVLNNLRLHPIQYLLVGIALVLFYLLLLSLSEYFGFGLAYLIAAGGISGLVTIYTGSATGRKTVAGIIGAVLALLYGYLYVLLQLEDYSLMFGSIGLFLVLAVVMFITRKVDWYNLGKSAPEKSE